MNSIDVRIEKINPATARIYLEKNLINRTVSRQRVMSFADDMRKGNWKMNGEAIQFNESGDLVNGQHRLNAVIESGCEVEMLVIRNIQNDISLFDRGRNRSISDSYIISGMDKVVASASSVAMAKLHYNIQNRNTVISDSNIKEFLIKHSESIITLNKCVYSASHTSSSSGYRVNVRTAPMCLAMLYAYESGISIEKLRRFNEVVRTGLHEGEHEFAATTLRNDFISGVITNKNSLQRRESTFRIEKAISDFNNGFPRKRSYANSTEQIYSNNNIFRE